MPEQSNDYRVVVFGAAGVGKSSLVLRFVKGLSQLPQRIFICCRRAVSF
jgi:GTPase SAR1 family protein